MIYTAAFLQCRRCCCFYKYAHNKLNEMHCNCLMRKLKEQVDGSSTNHGKSLPCVFDDFLDISDISTLDNKSNRGEDKGNGISPHFITLHSDYTLN